MYVYIFYSSLIDVLKQFIFTELFLMLVSFSVVLLILRWQYPKVKGDTRIF